jgi:ribosome modulation factor
VIIIPYTLRSNVCVRCFSILHIQKLQKRDDLQLAPSVSACSSISGSFHDRSPFMMPISSSAWVVKPVIFLP